MFTRLAEFRLAQSRRTAPGLREALTHCNDNLPGLRRPRQQAGAGLQPRRSPVIGSIAMAGSNAAGRLRPARTRRLQTREVPSRVSCAVFAGLRAGHHGLGEVSGCHIVFREGDWPLAYWLWLWSRYFSAPQSLPRPTESSPDGGSVIRAALENVRSWGAIGGFRLASTILRYTMILHRQHRISHNGLRTVLSGTRLLERCGTWLALGHRRRRQQVE